MSAPIPRSADLLVNMILNNPSILASVKTDPDETLRQLAEDVTKSLPPPPLVRDAGIYYIVVTALGLVAVAAMVGAIWLTLLTAPGSTTQIPETITALGAAAIGALAGLLTPSPTRQ